jgi:hypothetical protein
MYTINYRILIVIKATRGKLKDVAKKSQTYTQILNGLIELKMQRQGDKN